MLGQGIDWGVWGVWGGPEEDWGFLEPAVIWRDEELVQSGYTVSVVVLNQTQDPLGTESLCFSPSSFPLSVGELEGDWRSAFDSGSDQSPS
jgi:hypothetical protein